MVYSLGKLDFDEAGHGEIRELTVNVALAEPSEDHGVVAGHGCVQAVLRALSILKCLSQGGQGMTLTEIVRGTSLAPSTAHRLLTTMQSERFVEFEPEALRWLVGPEAHLVGNAFHPQRRRTAFQT